MKRHEQYLARHVHAAHAQAREVFYCLLQGFVSICDVEFELKQCAAVHAIGVIGEFYVWLYAQVLEELYLSFPLRLKGLWHGHLWLSVQR
jgi:hypothetical protein